MPMPKAPSLLSDADSLCLMRIVVKLEIRRAGGTISFYNRDDITKCAKELLNTPEGQATLKAIEKVMLKRKACRPAGA